MPSPHPSSSNNPNDGSRHLTWPEVAVLVVVLSFIVFLMWRGLSPQMATITAISATGAVLGLLVLPRRDTETVKLLRMISRSVDSAGPGDV